MEETAMRFLNIINGDAPPTPEHQAAMGKSIAEEVAAGRMIATGGLGKRATSAARLTRKAGKITVEDPPSGDGWMAAGGFAVTEAASKEEAITRGKAVLEMMGEGTLEMIQVSEAHPSPAFVPYPTIGVIPYLNVVGASEAGELYKKAFGATEIHRMPAEDGKRLMHLHLVVNGGSLMLSDVFPEYGHGHEPSGSYTMTLVLQDGKACWDRAVAAGMEVAMPFEKQMWGDTYGQLKDRFGVRWAISQPAQK
jgi:uncharacterized glyoxalase superfamily protein PhnB